jgi:TolB protein
VATVVAACVLLVGRSEPAKAAFPGENGRIAFVGRVEGIGDQIFAIKPDGTGEKQLTTSPGSYNITPSYSSDGSKIAWERNGDIWIMNADGTNRHSLTTSPARDASPAFSPSGRKVAFSRTDPESGRRDIYTKVLGGALRPVTNDKANDGTPVFSPDGTKIAFTRSVPDPEFPDCSACYGPSELAIVRPDGTGFKVIPNTPDGEASSPDWSPDGRRLVFQRFLYATEGYRIETIRADGTGLRIVFEHSTFWASGPVFSPDGTKIAFRYEVGHDIWKINPDGTGLTDVTNTPDRSESSPDWGPMPTATTTR